MNSGNYPLKYWLQIIFFFWIPCNRKVFKFQWLKRNFLDRKISILIGILIEKIKAEFSTILRNLSCKINYRAENLKNQLTNFSLATSFPRWWKSCIDFVVDISNLSLLLVSKIKWSIQTNTVIINFHRTNGPDLILCLFSFTHKWNVLFSKIICINLILFVLR